MGPLLFLIYVNDIGNACDGRILSFADDTNLFVSNSNLTELYNEATKQINSLYDWFCSNRLSLNAQKTKYMVIRPKHMRQDLTNFSIHINNIPLDRIGNACTETSTKFLGMFIDENLTWKSHIKHVNTKVSRALFLLKQVKHVLPAESLRTLYYSLINSHFAYGIIAWGNADKSIIKPSFMMQKRAIRVINNAPHNGHTEPLFKSSGILKLDDLFEYQCVMFMHDYLVNNLPMSFNGTFIANRDVPNARPTRQSNLLHIPRCDSNFARKLPYYFLPSVWNELARLIPDGHLQL